MKKIDKRNRRGLLWHLSMPHALSMAASLILSPIAAAVSVSQWMVTMAGSPQIHYGSDDPRLEPVDIMDEIDELVNEQLARGRVDRR